MAAVSANGCSAVDPTIEILVLALAVAPPARVRPIVTTLTKLTNDVFFMIVRPFYLAIQSLLYNMVYYTQGV